MKIYLLMSDYAEYNEVVSCEIHSAFISHAKAEKICNELNMKCIDKSLFYYIKETELDEG